MSAYLAFVFIPGLIVIGWVGWLSIALLNLRADTTETGAVARLALRKTQAVEAHLTGMEPLGDGKHARRGGGE